MEACCGAHHLGGFSRRAGMMTVRHLDAVESAKFVHAFDRDFPNASPSSLESAFNASEIVNGRSNPVNLSVPVRPLIAP
jgi:hypothetical protein